MNRPNSSGQSALLLLDVIDVLNKFRVSYAVIGALAAGFYGVVRASLDADAVISLKDAGKNLNSFIAELKTHFHVSHQRGDLEDPIGGVIKVTDRFHNQVDLIISIRGMKEDVFSRLVKTKFKDGYLQLIGIEDFIAMKIFAGSPKDLDDARGVLKISSKKINLALLRQVTSFYGKDAALKLEELLKEKM